MKYWKRIVCLLLSAAILFADARPAQAALTNDSIKAKEAEIDAAKKEVSGLKSNKTDLEKLKKELEKSRNDLTTYVTQLDQQLSGIQNKIQQYNTMITEKEAEIEETTLELEEAIRQQEAQYEAMKKRIQFMYEMDTEGMLEVLLSAENFADFLSKGEYIISIHNYDREMLEEYRNTKEEIAGKEQKLTEDEKLLADLQAQQEGKKQELAALVDSTSDKLGAAKKQLAAAQADVEAYEAEIQQQKAYEAELEKQKAAEDAKRMEEIKRQEEEMRKKQLQNNSSSAGGIRDSSSAGGTSGGNAGSSSGNGSNSGSGSSSNGSNSGSGSSGGGAQGSSSDLTLLAALIQCEAGGESYEGKLAVGSVVMNRVSSSHFPNTVAGVIYQGGQFSPVASGRFASVLAKGADRSCTQAASEVLGGNITIGTLYFRVNDGSIPGTVIGNHVFY